MSSNAECLFYCLNYKCSYFKIILITTIIILLTINTIIILSNNNYNYLTSLEIGLVYRPILLR